MTTKQHVAADKRAMRAQLEYQFGHLRTHPLYKNGRIEIGSKGEGRAWFFKLTELEEAASEAFRLTGEGERVTVHMGLIDPNNEKVKKYDATGYGGHVKGDAVLGWPCLWAEADHTHLKYDRKPFLGEEFVGEYPDHDRKAHNQARLDAFLSSGAKFGFTPRVHITGKKPTLRLQGMQRLDEPAQRDDARFWQAQKSLVAAMHCDTGATNSSQVLRLCGGVAYASKGTKKGEEGLEPRETEPVLCYRGTEARPISDNPASVSLAKVAQLLKRHGKLMTEAKAPSSTDSARNIADLRKKIVAPADAPDLDPQAVRDQVTQICENLATCKARENAKDGAIPARRDLMMRAAKSIGGYLWTSAFDPEEIVADGGELSLLDAFRASGGADDNGENGAAQGILDAMATGARSPLVKLQERSDGSGFGVADDDETAATDAPKISTAIEVLKLALASNAGVEKALDDASAAVEASDLPDAMKATIGRHLSEAGNAYALDDATEAEREISAAARILASKPAASNRFLRVRALDAMEHALEAARPHLVDDLIEEGSLVMFVGRSGAGKSFLAVDLACCIATGKPFIERQVETGLVLYCTGEGKRSFPLRLSAWAIHNKHVGALSGLEVCYTVPNLSSQKDADALVKEIAAMEAERGEKCNLVVIDTMATATTGLDENSAKDMGVAIENAKRISERAQVTVLLIHHVGKDASKGARGSTAILGAADTVLIASREKGNPEGKLITDKQRELDEGPPVAYRLNPVEIGTDAKGKDRSSLVVEWRGERKTADTGPKLLPAQAEAMRAIRRLVADRSHTEKKAEALIEFGAKDLRIEMNKARENEGRPALSDKSPQVGNKCRELVELKLLREIGAGVFALPEKGVDLIAVDDEDDE